MRAGASFCPSLDSLYLTYPYYENSKVKVPWMTQGKKKVQISFDEDLLESLDRMANERREPRSSLISEACRRFVEADRRDDATERQSRAYVEGYRRIPESPILARALASLTAEVLEKETW
jgi:hypothetical protein